ncbi:MAG TPA: glycosyltransferase, partial [Azospirillaceae bacterium]|nr:glycosyltransferase [Azospirillaceae bacterium]
PVLLESLRRLRDRAPSLRLVIVGDGEERERLRAETTRLGLGDVVHFTGHRTDVPALLAEADVYVLPSLSEGLPMALLEAMSVGLPVVASAVGDVPGAVPPEAGFVVPPGEVEPLAEALTVLAAAPERRAAMGRAARDAFGRRMTPARWAERTTAIYHDVMAERSPHRRTVLP